MQPPEEPTDDVSVRIEWPAQDEVWEPVQGTGRRRSRKPSRSVASAEQGAGSSDLLPARIDSTHRVPAGNLGADGLARLHAALAVERLSSHVDHLATMVQALEDRLAAREAQQNKLITSANQLAEDLKAVRKQIPVSNRAGDPIEDGTVERIVDAIQQAMKQAAPNGAVAKRGATKAAKASPGRAPARAKSTRKSAGASTATRRSKRAS